MTRHKNKPTAIVAAGPKKCPLCHKPTRVLETKTLSSGFTDTIIACTACSWFTVISTSTAARGARPAPQPAPVKRGYEFKFEIKDTP